MTTKSVWPSPLPSMLGFPTMPPESPAKPVSDTPDPSRSQLRRIAAQKGEPLPEFPASDNARGCRFKVGRVCYDAECSKGCKGAMAFPSVTDMQKRIDALERKNAAQSVRALVLESELDQQRAENAAMTAERDALQRRAEAAESDMVALEAKCILRGNALEAIAAQDRMVSTKRLAHIAYEQCCEIARAALKSIV